MKVVASQGLTMTDSRWWANSCWNTAAGLQMEWFCANPVIADEFLMKVWEEVHKQARSIQHVLTHRRTPSQVLIRLPSRQVHAATPVVSGHRIADFLHYMSCGYFWIQAAGWGTKIAHHVLFFVWRCMKIGHGSPISQKDIGVSSWWTPSYPSKVYQ